MKTRQTLCALACVALFTLLANASYGQLYSQDFDVDDGPNWIINVGDGIDLGTSNPLPLDSNYDDDGDGVLDIAIDANGDGIIDGPSDIFFDYSTVGIPSAPNSGGTTRGMKLQANLFSDAFGGFSVSPRNQSFTGDYRLKYDIWQNYVGNLDINSDPPDGPADGQTNLSTAGILTAGNVSNRPGVADGVWFTQSTDGDTGADYRVYSSDRPVSYQLPVTLPGDPDFCACDTDATYHAGGRNHLESLYTSNFGSVSAPAAQLSLFPGQTGMTQPGVTGMEWHEGVIEKIGDTVTWSLDGVLLITLDISNFMTPAGGENILFGHADINQGSTLEALSETLLFTLIDNIVVEVVAAAEDADFDGDLDVDGKDFLAWQRNFPITDGSALPVDGDANLDGDVLADDLGIWEAQFGTGVGPLASVGAVPEPASVVLLGMGVLGWMASRRRRVG